MKKIHIIGKDPAKIAHLKEKLEKEDFVYSEEDPDLVVCYGGDGMFLIAERMFPNVPKILLKDSEICNKCSSKLEIDEIIEKFKKKEYEIEEIKKLKAVFKGRFESRELVAVNDIVIRNSLPTEAIRFKVKVNGACFEECVEFVGDGVVVSTAYGSSKGAYFHSITQMEFEKGIGLAFNNTTEHHDYFISNEKDEIEIEIARGPGVLVADNNRDFINLEVGDKIKIKQIEDVAKRIVLK